MATSGTFAFNPSYAELVIEAFDRCQLRPAALTRDHFFSARRSLNLLFSEWANRGVNLWAVDLQSVPLVPGVATYAVPPETVAILDAYLETQGSSADPVDRLLFPISRSDYAALPDKVGQGLPTVFWFDRLAQPSLTLWQPPDANGPYTLNYYRMRQLQDASPSMGQAADVPYRFLEALAGGLAAKLAVKFAPALALPLASLAKAAWEEAAAEDRERVDLSLVPDLSSYWRR